MITSNNIIVHVAATTGCASSTQQQRSGEYEVNNIVFSNTINHNSNMHHATTEDANDDGNENQEEDVVDVYNDNPCNNTVSSNFDHNNDGHDDDCRQFTPCCESCKICCTLPFRLSSKDDESEGILWDDASPWDWDGGLYDLVCHMNGREQYPKLPDEIAKITVEATTKHVSQLKDQLMEAGLQRQYNQNYCGESLSSARIIAPFQFSELELGQILGTGGFNSVSEIIQIRPTQQSRNLSVQQQRKRNAYSNLEEKSRHYIMNNVICSVEKSTKSLSKSLKKSSKDTSECSMNEKSQSRAVATDKYTTRYVVKHLRNRLVTRTPEKFKRAAIDLIMEGQLLLMMDHPNIVGLHGWCGDGPSAFASGDPRGFFLILDKLPTSLEERMTDWRNRLIKCQRQFKRNTTFQQRSQIVTNWARKTLRRNNPNESKKIEAPSKVVVEIHNLLLERLTVAYKIGCAIQYMHSKRLMHRDLKVANVGFDIYGEVKLFDFGLSRILPSSSSSSPDTSTANSYRSDTMSEIYVMSRVGTKFYMAPEVRRKEAYGLPADVYSFGVLLWELLALATPREFFHHERDRLCKLHKEASSITAASGISTSRHKATTNQKRSSQEQLQGNERSKKDNNSSSHTTTNGWLPICPCWPIGIQNLVTSSMSNNPMDRPTIGQILVVLQTHIEALSNNDDDKNETSDISCTPDGSQMMKQKLSNASSSRHNQRVDLTSVDLRILDKLVIGE